MRAPARIVALLAVLAVLVVVPATAAAATPPTLEGPASGASGFIEGQSMDFEWRGSLQGDPDALDRSFFRLEVASASEVPSGAQSAWTSVENTQDTSLGVASGTVSLGVPAAGSYRWRVCAWGVVDDLAANQVQQLPGGCSAARSFATLAADVTRGEIGEMKIENKVVVPGRVVKVVQEQQQAAPTPPTEQPTQQREPAPRAPAPPPAPPVVEKPAEPEGPGRFQDVNSRSIANDAPAVELDQTGLRSELDVQRDGFGGAVVDALTSTLPIVPIPYWTLALLLACLPIAHIWRRDVMEMFQWADGSVDGRGTLATVVEDLPSVQNAQQLKVSSRTADGEAPAPVTAQPAPGRGRRAA